MKRLVWLLIALVGTALAQVQPVVSPLAQDGVCCCCEDQAGGCEMDPEAGMADCAACFTCVPAQPPALTTALVAAAADLSVISRLDCPGETAGELAYPPLLPPPRGMA